MANEKASENGGQTQKRDLTVNAKLKDNPRVVSVQYDFGSSLKEMVAKFGEEVVANNAEAQMTISLQSRLRSYIRANKTDAEIAAEIKSWKPGTRSVVRKSAQEKVKDAFGGMSAEDQKALLAELQKSLGKAAA